MPYSVTATFAEEQVKVEGVQPINMYALNASLSGVDWIYYTNYNQDIRGWGLDNNGDLQATPTVVYNGLPIAQDSVTTNTGGEIPEVNVGIPNVNRAIEAIIQDQQYLRGREIHLMTTFAKHLPSGGTAYHIGTVPDRHAVLK